ncbi:Calcium release-activated calcium channel protein 1-like [Oopsacas minuta]|uniref:Calcium release-activated calcium channel protein 1-like n=1 Tax=Oopsacas minuta TaxID=111878 RepID=A0AAV7K2E0_9METZ|nr:Calcium release-activated calcium channel protein 1-like [Oopsacas minuta]
MAENQINYENTAKWMELHISRNKLKTTSKISALLAGFAMVALIELSIQEYKNDKGIDSIYALTLYGIVTSVLIFLHIYSLMVSTCILPDLDYIATYEHTPRLGDFLIRTSPHKKYSTYVHVSWLFSNVLGNLCLLLDLLLILFIKFYPTNHSEHSNSNSTIPYNDNKFDPHYAPLICSVIVLGTLVFVYILSSLHILKIKVTHHTGTFGTRINEIQDDFSKLFRTFQRQTSTSYSVEKDSVSSDSKTHPEEMNRILPKNDSRILLSLDSKSQLLTLQESPLDQNNTLSK